MEYKNINGFENYIVYENGEIFNTKTNKKISTKKNSSGFLLVRLNNITFTASRIIYEAFISKLESNEMIIYKDNNPHNLHYKNLEKVNKSHIKKNIEDDLDKNKEWKIIPNYPDYKISNHGEVYSIKLKRLLNPNKNLNGYFRINLIKNGKRHNNYIHRLVFDSFVGIKNIKNHIDHIDRNIINNHISNLREATPQENSLNRVITNKRTFPILQYSLNDEFIKEWNSPKEIKESLNIQSTNVLKCCMEERIKAGNFKWKYKNIIDNNEEYKDLITDDNKKYSKYKINKNGIVINKLTNLIITQHINGGYSIIRIMSDDGKGKSFRIHRLVALAFLPNPYNYKIVNHIDKNKLNNNLDNLEWCTIQQNVNHSLSKKIHQIDIETNKTINIFISISEASRIIVGRKDDNIGKVIRGEKLTAYGYKWILA
jgi:hypothetical protein